MDMNVSMSKIIESTPDFIVKVRKYGTPTSPPIPIPKMNLTSNITKENDAKMWIERVNDQVFILTVIDTKNNKEEMKNV